MQRADHAHSRPGLVPHRLATVLQPDIVPVLGLDAVFQFERLAGLEMPVQRVAQQIDVVGMNPGKPGVGVIAHLGHLVAQQILHLGRMPQGIGHRIPVVDAIDRGVGHEVEPLEGLAQFPFGPAALGNVLVDAADPQDAPGGVAHHFDLLAHLGDFAVRPDDAKFESIAGALADRIVHRRSQALDVIRMHRRVKAFEGDFLVPLLAPEHAEDFVGPVPVVRCGVPVPVADARDALGVGETRLAAAQFLFRAALFGDVLNGPAQADDLARIIETGLAGFVDDASLAVGTDHSIVGGVRLPPLPRPRLLRLETREIVRMDHGADDFVGQRLARRIEARDAIDLFGPERLVPDQIPVPAADVRDALGIGEARLAGAQLLLGAALLGNVLDGSADPRRGAVLDEGDLGFLVDDADLAVGADNPMIAAERLAAGDPLLDCDAQPRAVAGVNRRVIIFQRQLEGLGILPEDAKNLVRPVELAVPDIPFPAADMGDALGVGQARLAAAQPLFRLLAFRDVQHRTEQCDRLARRIENRFGIVLERSDLAIRPREPEIERIGLARRQRALDRLLHGCPIVGMDVIEKELIVRRRFFGLKAEHRVGALRPPQRFRFQIPFPAAQATDALGVGEARLAAAQLLLGFLVVGDIEDDPVHPAERPVGIANYASLFRRPADRAVGMENAVFVFVGNTRRHARRDFLISRRAIVGMDHTGQRFRSGIDEIVRPAPGQVADLLADIFEGPAVAGRTIYGARDIADHARKPLFAFPRRLLGQFPRGDVEDYAVEALELPVGTAHGMGRFLDPDHRAVRVADPVLVFVGNAGFDASCDPRLY